MEYTNLLDIESPKILLEVLNRDQMPQFDNENLDRLKKELDEKGIIYTEENIETSQLSPTQENFDPDKVKDIRQKIENEGSVPRLIVSEDYSILDGHHRWKAAETISRKLKLPVLRIHLPRNKALINLDDINEMIKGGAEDLEVVAVYPGRFQPFHRGHERTFNVLRDHFGKSDTYIATSDKSDSKDSPFGFAEKRRFITKLFGIPNRFVVEVKSPYSPKEILEEYDEESTVLVVGIGQKNTDRLSGSNYYEEYSPDKISSYGKSASFKERGFYFPVGHDNDIKLNGEAVSGSDIRSIFRSDIGIGKKKKLFEYVFGQFDKEMFKLLLQRLKKKEESKILDDKELEVLSEKLDLKELIQEATRTKAAVPADDGPASWHSSDEDYENHEKNLAKELGYEVVDYMLGSETYDPEDLKQDALKFVSFFPTGVMDKHTEDPLQSYYNFSEAVATGAGYEVLDYIGLDEPEDEDTDEEPELDTVPDDYVPDEDESPSEDETETSDEDMGGIASLDESLRNSRKSLLFEGGGFGHLNHPYEDRSLTFNEFGDIIVKGFEGTLDEPVEKTDGQNLKVTWKDGSLRASRNKGHIKNAGENSLDIQGIAEKYEGRGKVQEAFVYAMKDLSSAFSDISDNKLRELFKDGRRFLSLEVIYPPTQNVIPYGRSLLVFHNITEYDDGGDPRGKYPQYADRIFEIIEDKGEKSQKKFNIERQPKIKLKDISKDKKDKLEKILSKLDELKDRFELKKSDEIALYHEEWWKRFIRKKAKEYNYNIPPDILTGLLKRWVYRSKSGENGYSLREAKKDINNDDFLSFVREFDKEKHGEVLKRVQKPFEIMCLKAGAEILKSADYSLAEDKEDAREKLVGNLKDCIENIKKAGDKNKRQKLQRELKRLKKTGGTECIVPCEGIVFKYKGDMYKFTGAFASVNQIMGILRYDR